MVTQIIMIPELNLGIIVLTNQQEVAAFNSISSQILDAYLGLPGFDRVHEMAVERNQELAEGKKITDSIWSVIHLSMQQPVKIEFNRYSAVYRDQWLGDVTISLKNGHYWFESKRSPKLSGEMIPYKNHSFVVRWRDRSLDADAFVFFHINETGKADSMKMRPISPLTDFSYDFQDLDFRRLP
jgi:hypothetical protein